MRWLLLLILPLFLFAEDNPPIVPFEILTIPSGSVSIASGQYSEIRTDLTVNCAEPITLTRTYSSGFHYDGHRGHWQIAQEQIRTYIKPYATELQIWLDEEDGGSTLFEGADEWGFDRRDCNVWDCHPIIPASYTNISSGELSGQTNIRGLQLQFHYASYGFTLTKGNGERRVYTHTGTRASMSRVRSKENSNTVHERFLLQEIVRPNGNRIRYSYDSEGRPLKIESYSSDREILFGWIRFEYVDEPWRIITKVTTSDHQSMQYEQYRRRLNIDDKDIIAFLLERVLHPSGLVESYGHDYNKKSSGPFPVKCRVLPEERRHNLVYYHRGDSCRLDPTHPIRRWDFNDPRIGRVSEEYRPVGANGALVRTVEYVYGVSRDLPIDQSAYSSTHVTEVYDAYGCKTRYEMDRFDRLKRIKRFDLSGALDRTEHFVWDDSEAHKGNLRHRYIQDANCQTLASHQFAYDARGNVTVEIISGNLTGNSENERYIRHYGYSNDGFNNLLSESDDFLRIQYEYVPCSNRLLSKLVFEEDQLRERTFRQYNSRNELVKITVDDGWDKDPQSLSGVTHRAVTLFTYRPDGLSFSREERFWSPSDEQEHLFRRIVYSYDEHNRLIGETIIDANEVERYTLRTTYDEAGHVTCETNALGHEEHFSLDVNGNCTAQWTAGTGITTTFSYDYSDRRVSSSKKRGQQTLLQTHTTYDLLGRTTKETDGCGNETQFVYDSLSRVAEERLPMVRTPDGWEIPIIHREHDSLDRVTCEIDPNQGSTHWWYNVRGQPIERHNPDGTIETWRYDLRGRLVEETAKNGAVTTYQLDYQGRATATDQMGVVTTITYQGPHKIAETDGRGITTYFSYNHQGQLIEQTRGDTRLTFFYDTLGRKVEEREYIDDETYTATTWEYDLLDRVLSECVGDSIQTDYTYDLDGNCTSTTSYPTSTEAQTTTTEYDFMGNPILTIDPLGEKSITRYDRCATLEGHHLLLVTHIDPLGRQKHLYHDTNGNVVLEQILSECGHLLSQTDHYTDLRGNIVKTVHTIKTPNQADRQVTTCWRYGPGNRLEELEEGVDTPEYRSTSYTYNKQGQLAHIRKPSGIELHHTYDPLGRLSTYGDITYIYDANNNVIEAHSSTGTTYRTYDSCDRLIQETLETGLTFIYTYDRQGRRTSLTLPDYSSVHYTYDSLHMRSVTRYDAGGSLLYSHHYLEYDFQGKILVEELITEESRTTSWDPLGRPTSITTPAVSETNITYDKVGNLISYDLDTNASSFAYDGLDQLIEEPGHSYQYDSLHNRISKDFVPYTLNPLNQLLSNQETNFAYDEDGNLSHTSEQTSYTCDIHGHIIAITAPSYRLLFTYDAFDRRLTKAIQHPTSDGWITSSTECYLYEKEMEIGAIEDDRIFQFRALGIGLGAEIGAAISIELDGMTYVPSYDHRGSVLALHSETQPTAVYNYTAFGECQAINDPVNPWRFLSKRTDAETNLTHFGRRTYDPSTGRWLTPDPSGYDAGPNLYAYCLNRPLTQIDLYGLFGMEFTIPRHGGTTTLASTLQSVSAIAGGITEWIGTHLAGDSDERERLVRVGCALQGKPYDPELLYPEPTNFVIGNKPLSTKLRHRFVNGILNTRSQAERTAERLSDDFMSTSCHHTYVPSRGGRQDLRDCLAEYSDQDREMAWYLAGNILQDLSELDDDGILVVHAHSRGGLITAGALALLSPETCQRIEVYTYGSPHWIERSAARRVVNYVSDKDAVSRFARAHCPLENRHLYDVEKRRARSRIPLIDHCMQGDTYLNAAEEAIRDTERRYLR